MKTLMTATLAAMLLCACGGGGEDDDAPSGSVSSYRCSDFTRQSDAQAAYNRGATQLDGDKDGIACESLQ
ncbi:MAG: hypothetical protein RL654_126 [Pseudomonadota bacterium]|jgi:hypothetical protein